MNVSNADKALVLNQALPYIQKYYGKTIVIKYGGNAMTDEGLKQAVMSDIVLLSAVGIHVVLVHGGGPEITKTLEEMGRQSSFIEGLRYTDKETAKVVQMVLAGKTNKDLVNLLQSHGARAMGLCGIDGGLLRVRRREGQPDLGYVGVVESVDPAIIRDAFAGGYIPVIATVGTDAGGDVYNINADTAAAAIAGRMGAENLILMTDTRGLLRNASDEGTLIPEVQVSQVPSLMREGVIKGGMIPKVECCVEAVRRGVSRAFIIDGRIPHALLIEMFSDEGIGTMFR